MFGRDGRGLRGRNVEDLDKMEEEGLLSHSRQASHSGIDLTKGQGLEKRRMSPMASPMLSGKVEKVAVEEEASEGLTSTRDKQAFALLIVLCTFFYASHLCWKLTTRSVRAPKTISSSRAILTIRLQGIPLGLTFGTLPFLLKQHLSYSQLAIFALSTWPYSLKLLWSPIVDAWFLPRWGRRKSWIVPVQAIVGLALWQIGGNVQSWLDAVSECLQAGFG